MDNEKYDDLDDAIMEALKLSCEDQNELLKKAKELDERENG